MPQYRAISPLRWEGVQRSAQGFCGVWTSWFDGAKLWRHCQGRSFVVTKPLHSASIQGEKLESPPGSAPPIGSKSNFLGKFIDKGAKGVYLTHQALKWRSKSALVRETVDASPKRPPNSIIGKKPASANRSRIGCLSGFRPGSLPIRRPCPQRQGQAPLFTRCRKERRYHEF